MKRIGVTIDLALFKRVKIKCVENDISLTEYIINLIKKDLDTKKDIHF